MTPSPIVFLVDVDNTLIDNDRIQNDLKRHLEREFGAACRDRYWAILEQLFTDLGYRDYLGALQRYRVKHPQDIHLLFMSSYLVDYPLANRLYPASLDVLERFRSWGQTVILSDGDVVFQPRKIERSGIFEAGEGHVLIYIHNSQTGRAGGCRAALPGRALCPRGQQAAYPDRRQEGLELACDHGIRSAGPACPRSKYSRSMPAC
jgi:hypothetical protein